MKARNARLQPLGRSSYAIIVPKISHARKKVSYCQDVPFVMQAVLPLPGKAAVHCRLCVPSGTCRACCNSAIVVSHSRPEAEHIRLHPLPARQLSPHCHEMGGNRAECLRELLQVRRHLAKTGCLVPWCNIATSVGRPGQLMQQRIMCERGRSTGAAQKPRTLEHFPIKHLICYRVS